MNDSKCAAKLRAQLKRFLGELLPHFSRPKVSFLGDMIYGLMAGGDVKLSSICRAYRASENDELEKVFGIIIAATGGRGIFIYDRGGDNIEFYRYFLEKNVDFIVRLKNWGCPTIHRLFTCNPKPTPLNASPSTGLNGACLCVRNQFLPTRGPSKPTLLQELQAALHSSASQRDNRAPRGPYGSLPA